MNKLFSYGFLFVGITFALLAGPSEVETLKVAFDSDSLVETTAEVTANHTRKHPKGPDTQTVEYAFWVDGKHVRGDNHITRLTDRPDEVERLVHTNRGSDSKDTIQVFYKPGDPSVSAIHRDIGYAVPLGILGFTALCLILGLEGVLNKSPDRRARQT